MALSRTFAALADPTRRAILAQLRAGELTVGALAEPHDMTLPAVTKHLRVLEDAGLLTRRKLGRQVICAATPAPLGEAADWLTEQRDFWEAALDRLEDLVAQPSTRPHTPSEEKP